VFPRETRRRYEGGDPEERRLFYVALTRARDAVYLSAFTGKTNRFQLSDYLLEVAGDEPPRLEALSLPGAPESGGAPEPVSLDVSFSNLAVFEECGHRYRLAHALGFQTQIAPELGYGRAIHHVLRHLADMVRTSGQLPDTPALDQLVAEEFFVPFASPQAWETMRRAARRLVAAYANSYSQDLERVWAAERPFALHLDEGTISGRADVILDREGGRAGALAVVHYKVAADESHEERYREQLRVYTLAGRGEGLSVGAAYLHELRDGTRRRAVDVSESVCLGHNRAGQAATGAAEAGRIRPCAERRPLHGLRLQDDLQGSSDVGLRRDQPKFWRARLVLTQKMRPRRSQKWQRQPVCRHTEGQSVTAPSSCTRSRQPGRVGATRFSCRIDPQPQGQRSAAYQSCPFSPMT
jgi:DNA helicase-2/ATP-dependent DNA helicase PcrA